jgi:hypothetical protein
VADNLLNKKQLDILGMKGTVLSEKERFPFRTKAGNLNLPAETPGIIETFKLLF